MFTKVYEFTIESAQVVDFVRLLGRQGLKFDMSDEMSIVNPIDPWQTVWFRQFRVYATKREMDELKNFVDVIAKWCLH